jgi:hypothetical protein
VIEVEQLARGLLVAVRRAAYQPLQVALIHLVLCRSIGGSLS